MTDLEIVQEAQKVIEEMVAYWRNVVNQVNARHAQLQLNSWLAHKAFFERHKRLETYAGDLCEVCEYSEYRASYPCPELVAQVKAIMGVE